jgi:MFS family permease
MKVISEKTIDKEEELTQLELMDDEEFYTRFSPTRKKVIVFIVSLSCFLSPLSSMSFLPAVSIIALEFNTSGTMINVSNAVYNFMMAFSTILISPLGPIYGKRWTFIACLTLFVIASVLTAVSKNLAMFFVFRALSALSGTPVFSIGSTILGDIYEPAERGSAMGLSLLGSQLGPAFGPVIGGIIVTYTSWRVIFWIQVGLSAIDLALAVLFLPETSRITELAKKRRSTGKSAWFVGFNPFRVVIALFRYLNLTLAGIISMSIHFNMFSLLTPIRYVVDPRFGLEKPIFGGLFYLAPGFGYVLGAFLGGHWADRHVLKYIRIRGRRVPEDRLHSMLIAYGIFLPGTILIYGWCLQKEKGGMALPLIMMFIGGVAQTICYPSINTYCVDSMPQLRGDAISGNYFVRFIAAGISSASVLTEINHIGVGWTCTISAIFMLLGFCCCLALIKYGEQLRSR